MANSTAERFAPFLRHAVLEERLRLGHDPAGEELDAAADAAMARVKLEAPGLYEEITRSALENMFHEALEESVADGDAVRYKKANGETVYRATRAGRERLARDVDVD